MILGLYLNRGTYYALSKGEVPSGIQLLAEEAAKEDITLVALTSAGIDWWHQTIKGRCYSKDAQVWEQGVYPFPNVIYDRATLGKSERESGKLTRQRFRDYFRIPFINNNNSFGKWNTHKSLMAYLEINVHLPETYLYRHPYYLNKLLQAYQFVYLKATAGSMGKNIYRVSLAYDNVLVLSYRKNGRNYNDTMTIDGFHSRVIKGKLQGKRVIIQQGIDLACLGAMPFDIRLLVQKDQKGVWGLVDKSVRLAPEGSVVTNISSGARVERFDEVVPAVFAEKFPLISQGLETLTLAICHRLEDSYGLQGELGIDMALDKGGRLWLIEVNAKPSKISVRKSGDKNVIERAYSNPVKYAKYLYEEGRHEANKL